MAERLPLRRWQRQAVLLAVTAALGVGSGCLKTPRVQRCEEFVVAADACLAQAGEASFFSGNVECESPLSTLREYTCLVDGYERAVDNGLCRDLESAELIVDFVSLTCLGWSGELSDDDDSGDDDSGDDDSGDDDSAR